MIPLTSLDSALLLAETEEMPLHNLGVLYFERGALDDEGFYRAVRARFERGISLTPAFRRRLVQGRSRLGDLHWIDAPRFDLDAHVVRRRIAHGGGHAEIDAFLGEYGAELLDRERPLWEAVALEGLTGGRHALVVKVHHAAMDGGELAKLLEKLFSRDAPPEAPREVWRPARAPGPVALSLSTLRTLSRKPSNASKAALEAARALVKARATAPSEGERPARLEIPDTPWRGALSRGRAVAHADFDLAELKAIGATYGATVNDVVLAASAGALRRWLLERGALPEAPLVANVPVALPRTSPEEGGNVISLLRIPLPTRFEDPVERLTRVCVETARAKSVHRAKGSNPYRRLTDFALALVPPRVVTSAVGLYSRHGVADLHPPGWNVVISNVAGPRGELGLEGARLVGIHPFGPVQQGSGLNLTVMSAAGRLGLGVLSCAEKVPDPQAIARAFAEDVAELGRRARGG